VTPPDHGRAASRGAASKAVASRATASPGAPSRGGPPRGAFLLAQVGAFAAIRFAERLEGLGLTPGDVGLLRLIAANAGQSQQTLAQLLGVAPSRVVALIDDLQAKDLVIRARSATDRRSYELRLTRKGGQVMEAMREIGSAHEDDVLGVLTAAERQTLRALLAKLAEGHALTPDVHPGYRTAT
jgi:DNA-binding MarR family transcriptional regulator